MRKLTLVALVIMMVLIASNGVLAKPNEEVDITATDHAPGELFGFEEGEAPPLPDIREFPYPIKDYSLTIDKNKAKLSIQLETEANVELRFGKKKAKEGNPEKIVKKETSSVQNVTIPLVEGANFIDLRIINDQFSFETVITIENGKVKNNLALHSNYSFTDSSSMSIMATNYETEPNDDYNSSGVKDTESGDTNNGTLSDSDTEDWWEFTIDHKFWINLFLDVPAGTDYDFYVYEDGNFSSPVLSGNDFGDVNELLTMEPLDAGTYYIRVNGFDTDGTDSYSMSWRIVRHWPVDWNTSMSRGFDPYDDHYGLDILPSIVTYMGPGCHNGCYKGNPIVAFQDGTVTIAGSVGGYGIAVYINHGQQEDGNYIQSRYGHLYSENVSVGQVVKAGDIIGYMGNRGTIYSQSHGTHLHFDILEDNQQLDNGTHDYIYHQDPIDWFPGY